MRFAYFCEKQRNSCSPPRCLGPVTRLFAWRPVPVLPVC